VTSTDVAEDVAVTPSTEPSYRTGTPERHALEAALAEVRGAEYDLPLGAC
jgi:hypothetical protein